MSRSQQSSIYDTATSTSATDQQNADADRAAETADISDYEKQLSQYAAKNPYVDGGEYQTSQNQTLAGTADVGSGAIKNQVQTQAQRTGENQGAATEVAAEAARKNQRDMATEEASANAQRIESEAGYDQGVVQASAVPAQLEQGMYATTIGAGNTALNTGEDAAKTPSFFDELGAGFASGLGSIATAGINKCWIAAELYGGWYEPRTVAVRRWLSTKFVQRWYGPAVLALYSAVGKQTAWCIRRMPVLRGMFLPLFDRALELAGEV